MNTTRASLLLAAMMLAACGGGGSPEPSEGGGLVWIEGDFEAALAAASEAGKPILMDLYADWCGPCRTLSGEYFTSDEMHDVLSGCVLLRANIDSDDGAVLADRYGASAIPLVVVLSSDGTEVGRITGVTPSISEYRAELERIISGI
jgi:thiol:disulfide interchange protein DsbD